MLCGSSSLEAINFGSSASLLQPRAATAEAARLGRRAPEMPMSLSPLAAPGPHSLPGVAALRRWGAPAAPQRAAPQRAAPSGCGFAATAAAAAAAAGAAAAYSRLPRRRRGGRWLSVPRAAAGLEAPAWAQRAVAEEPWRGGLEPCGDVERYEVPAARLEGTLPPELRGTLYRIGPGRSRVGENRYGHWFDGDGQVTAVEFDGPSNRAFVTSRFVRTERFLAQEEFGVDGFATRGAWTQASGGLFSNLFRIPTNPSNTSVLVHQDRVLALCEGGLPFEVEYNVITSNMI